MKHQKFDIIIVGAGLVGSSFAYALKKLPLNIAIIESQDIIKQAVINDKRSIALSRASYQVLQNLGLWQAISHFATPIKSIHVSEQGKFAFTHFNCQDMAIDAFGYVVLSQQLKQYLQTQAQTELNNLTWFCPSKIQTIHKTVDDIEITLDNNTIITTKLLVATDGSRSIVRQQLNFATKRKDYQQTALVANVHTEYSHKNTAYERFTELGPLAVLPLLANQSAIIWSIKHPHQKDILDLSDEELLPLVQSYFGKRLGQWLAIEQRQAYPLQAVSSQSCIAPKVVLMGNAAHTVHPVAGQGFNLGMRDVAVLVELLTQAVNHKQAIDDFALLKNYQQWRSQDQLQTQWFTDSLVEIFNQSFLPIKCLRRAGLMALELSPLIKQQFCQYSMGLSGRLPSLIQTQGDSNGYQTV